MRGLSIVVVSLLVPLAACSSGGSSGSDPLPDGSSGGTGGSLGGTGGGGAGGAGATGGAATDGGDAAPDAPAAPTVLFPKTGLQPDELAVLVNEQDPQSVEVGAYFAQKRGVPSSQIVKLSFPVGDVMSQADFSAQKPLVDALPATVQGLVVSWTKPYRVDCMAVTAAFALGFDKKYCNQTGGACGATASSAYFGSDSTAPFTDHGLRPAMMLAAKTAADAKALVDRGQSADDTYPTGEGWLIRTTDSARSVRYPMFVELTQAWNHPEVMKLNYVDNASGAGSDVIENQQGVLFYLTGLASVPKIETNQYRPGALADHVTSYGGQVPTGGQMSVVAWLEAGATASYGTVVEPCNYTQKFPDPRQLVPRYYRGASALEAYWKSVQWPGEGLFVGEPLARPWGSSQVAWVGDTLEITTTLLDPKKSYALESAPSASGPFTPVKTGIQIPYEQRAKITLPAAAAPVYRLVPEG